MRTIDTYRNLLQRILKDSPGDSATQTHLRYINVAEEELPIMNLLHKEHTISLCSAQSYNDYEHIMAPDEDGVVDYVRPFDGYIVTFNLADEDSLPEELREIVSIRTRLDQLDRWSTKYPKGMGVSNNTSEDGNDGSAVIIARHGGFVSFGSGLQTFNGSVFLLPKIQAIIFELLLQNYGNFSSASRILHEVGRNELPDVEAAKSVSKMIHPLNVELERLLHYQPIKSSPGRGWVLEFKT